MQDFKAIAAKLKRAEENIYNLNSEMERFFNESDYPTLPQDDRELHRKAVEYHMNRVIPPRFSVLVGEIIHHLRSSFDHVVWHFSVGSKVNNMPVDFPVYLNRPIEKGELARYEGKIQRITDGKVRSLIERLQPYNSADPPNNSLWLIHDLDIVDKHRELILCEGTPSIALPGHLRATIDVYQRAHPELDTAQVARKFKRYGTFQPCISFRNFGGREIESVTEGLVTLFNYTAASINDFREI